MPPLPFGFTAPSERDLDQAVALDAVVAAVPGVSRPLLEEAALMLDWAGMVAVVRRPSQRVLLPTRRRDTLLLSLGKEVSPLVKVSDLK